MPQPETHEAARDVRCHAVLECSAFRTELIGGGSDHIEVHDDYEKFLNTLDPAYRRLAKAYGRASQNAVLTTLVRRMRGQMLAELPTDCAAAKATQAIYDELKRLPAGHAQRLLLQMRLQMRQKIINGYHPDEALASFRRHVITRTGAEPGDPRCR